MLLYMCWANFTCDKTDLILPIEATIHVKHLCLGHEASVGEATGDEDDVWIQINSLLDEKSSPKLKDVCVFSYQPF